MNSRTCPILLWSSARPADWRCTPAWARPIRGATYLNAAAADGLSSCRTRHAWAHHSSGVTFCWDAGIATSQASAVSLTLCVLLWPWPGAEGDLIAYEDSVLGLVPEYGGRVLQRARGSGTAGQPLEIQLLEFPSAQALDAFMADGRRQALAGERDRAISKTEVIEVQLVGPAAGP